VDERLTARSRALADEEQPPAGRAVSLHRMLGPSSLIGADPDDQIDGVLAHLDVSIGISTSARKQFREQTSSRNRLITVAGI